MHALSVLRFLFSFCSGTVFFLCFSGQHIAKGEGFSSKQLIVFVFLLTRCLRRFLCVTFLCVKTEPHRECRSMLFKRHTWKSHQNLGMPKAGLCPQIPHHCLKCRLVIKLICWLGDTQEGWEFRFLCPAIGLSWRGSMAWAASFPSEKQPIL